MTKTLKIEGMMCGHCEMHAKKALEALDGVAKAEVSHEKRYRAFVKKLDAGFFKSDDDETEWECVACGYIAVGAEAPKFCPVCGKPIKYFREAISYDED